VPATPSSTIPGLDLERLARFLAPALGLDPGEPLRAELIVGGKSNLTYRLAQGERTWVLRRPPLGHRMPTAHSMRREETVLRALADSDVPVPRVVATCDDPEVLGAGFYVMEEVDGMVVREPADVRFGPDDARRCSEALVDTLATLHAAPYEALGLGGFGRPEGFMARQVERWQEQLARGRARPLDALDRLGERVAERIPRDGGAAIVHGDYRIDNVLLDRADPGRVAAVLDWEMATIGDPLADLGMLLMYWGRPGDDFASDVHAITALPGFLDRDEVAARYEARSGRSLAGLDAYIAFAHFKLGVIVEGIVARHLAGQTVGEGFDRLQEIAPRLAEAGLKGLSR
jgi:aminoglycoside phosphotransferase (APT) family kinase protein